jgi:hypothetical protein
VDRPALRFTPPCPVPRAPSPAPSFPVPNPFR